MSKGHKISDRNNPWREVLGMLEELAAMELGLLPDMGNLVMSQSFSRQMLLFNRSKNHWQAAFGPCQHCDTLIQRRRLN